MALPYHLSEEIDVANSRHIAKLLGPTLVALCASEVANPQIWIGVAATQVYLAGTLWLVAGLSIVCTHNRWVLAWPVLVTLIGWFAVFGGVFRMFAPELAQRSVPSPVALLAIQLLLFALGAFLAYKAFANGKE